MRKSAAMLEVRDLRKSFDGFQAVGGVSFTRAPRGSISAIIGPNGAGKTTLFNLITGHVEPDAGRVVFKERRHHGHRPPRSLPPRHGALVPADEHLPAPHRVRERPGRLSCPTAGAAGTSSSPVDAALPGREPGAARVRSVSSTRRAEVARLSLPRQPEAARARPRAGARAGDPAARRADGRHVGRRDARVHPAHRAHRARARA